MEETKTNGEIQQTGQCMTDNYHTKMEKDVVHEQNGKSNTTVNGAVESIPLHELHQNNCKTNGAGPPTTTATVPTNVALPPDGGWGWVVVAASFCCNLVVDGIIYSFGMFLPELVKSFGESKAKVSLIGSLLSGSYLIAGKLLFIYAYVIKLKKKQKKPVDSPGQCSVFS